MIWALSDPHLSLSVDKPMDVFGSAWENYTERMAQAWRERVQEKDIVLLPGDISWAMRLEEAEADLRFLHELPGQKYLSRGNHDYWWPTGKKLQDFVEKKGLNSLHFQRLGADLLQSEGRRVILFSTRGWMLPGDRGFKSEDEKILQREVARLHQALQAAEALWEEGDAVIAMLHYPPVNKNYPMSPFHQALREAKIPYCIYGHLHGRSAAEGPQGEVDGVYYQNVAADYLEMKPLGLPLFQWNRKQDMSNEKESILEAEVMKQDEKPTMGIL